MRTISNASQYKWRLNNGETETIISRLTPIFEFKNGSEIDVDVIRFNRDKIFTDWQLSDDVIIKASSYDMYTNTLYYQGDRSKSFTYELYFEYGDFYGGKIFSWNVSPNLILNKHFRVGAYYEFNHIEFPLKQYQLKKGIYQSNLANVNVSVFLSRFFSIKLLAQYDDLSKQLGGNLRLRYNPKEGTDLYIVFNQLVNNDRLRKKPELPVIDNRAIVIKFVKTFEL